MGGVFSLGGPPCYSPRDAMYLAERGAIAEISFNAWFVRRSSDKKSACLPSLQSGKKCEVFPSGFLVS